MKKIISLSVLYVLSLCSANAAVNTFGVSIIPITAFVLIGIDIAIRDNLHDKIGFLGSILLVIVTGAIGFITDESVKFIATASVLSFLIASIVDAAVYQLLISKRFIVKSNLSNFASSLIDSLVFPLIAFGFISPSIFTIQLLAKVSGGFFWALLMRRVM